MVIWAPDLQQWVLMDLIKEFKVNSKITILTTCPLMDLCLAKMESILPCFLALKICREITITMASTVDNPYIFPNSNGNKIM